MIKQDSAMCANTTCPSSKLCWRHADSGRAAANSNQIWFAPVLAADEQKCEYFVVNG
jgi:hypothetical protein